MISAAQARWALALLDWTPLTLAMRAFLDLDDVAKAQDDITIQHLCGLQLGAVLEALETAGVEFLDHGAPGVRLRGAER
jgi:hypothetical protein